MKQIDISRRDFIKVTSAAAMLGSTGKIFAKGSDKLRVGIIGCGGRGTGAAWDCVNSSINVEIYAMADMFKEQLNKSLRRLSEGDFNDSRRPTPLFDSMDITPERCFVGFDAYKKLIATDIDIVILAGPPAFRPMHLKAAIEAGKHVFMEKPVAVDPVGVRSVLESTELAKQKGLAIVAGTQRRHQAHYCDIIKRIHNGDIGEILAGQCYYNTYIDGRTYQPTPEMSQMEQQLRNWYYYTWLSGDHIVEQHVHNLDIINWAIGSHPVKCTGIGGRQVRTESKYGNIYDHFTVEYEYPNDVRVMGMCRQIPGCSMNVGERLTGSKGNANISTGSITGPKSYSCKGPNPDPYIQEHTDLIDSIRNGTPLNEGKQVAESTLTAIMGRMSAYTGRTLKWDWVLKSSRLDLSPAKYEMGENPVEPVAMPGRTKLM